MSTENTSSATPVDSLVIPYEELQYGFQYGAAKVTRLFSDKKKGWVTLGIETPKQTIQVYVTKTGKIRIHDSDGEWFRLAKD
jgi:hypothetical protein